MKKTAFTFICLLFLLTGCSSPTEDDVPVIDDTYITDNCKNAVATAEKVPSHTINMYTGGEGFDFGHFRNPKDLAVFNNSIFVVDYGNHRVQKFDSGGKFLLTFGRLGSRDGQFNEPMGIAIDPHDGNVYIADTWNHRIQVFAEDGNFLKTLSIPELNLFGPRHLQIKNKILYIADTGNHRIVTINLQKNTFTTFGQRGKGNTEFDDPTGIAVDDQQHIYVLDTNNKKIKKFSATGDYLLSWGLDSWKKDFIPDSQLLIHNNALYVPDIPNNTINIYSLGGKLLSKLKGKFNSVYGISAIKGKLYITDPGENKIVENKL